MKKLMLARGLVELLLYSPNRPLVDVSVIFVWLMGLLSARLFDQSLLLLSKVDSVLLSCGLYTIYFGSLDLHSSSTKVL